MYVCMCLWISSDLTHFCVTMHSFKKNISEPIGGRRSSKVECQNKWIVFLTFKYLTFNSFQYQSPFLFDQCNTIDFFSIFVGVILFLFGSYNDRYMSIPIFSNRHDTWMYASLIFLCISPFLFRNEKENYFSGIKLFLHAWPSTL